MSRDPRYQRLLNSKQWKLLRAEVFRRTNGLCELCLKEGIITPGVDVHHIRPVEQAKTVQEMERLAYNPANCQLLCVEHHIKVHQSMHTHCKEKVKENKERARRRFLEANDPNYNDYGIQTEIHEGPVRETGADRTSETQAQTNAESNGGRQGDMG